MTDVFNMLRNAEAKIKQLTEERDSAVAWRELALVAIKAGVSARKIPDVVYRATLPGKWTMSNTKGLVRKGHEYTDTKEVSPEEAVQELRAELHDVEHLWDDQQPASSAPVTKPKPATPSTPAMSVADTYADGNPWLRSSFNLSRQSEIAQKNPELAKKLAAEAGRPVISEGVKTAIQNKGR